MKKKLLILLLCLLVVSQLAFAREQNMGQFNVSFGAKLEEIDDNIRLVGFQTNGKVNLKLSDTVTVGTDLAYSHIINSDTYVEGKANRFGISSNVAYAHTFDDSRLNITPTLRCSYIDASTIDSDTGEITAPTWTIESLVNTTFVNKTKNTNHNLLFGVSQELTKEDGFTGLSHFGRYILNVKDRYTTTATLRYDSVFIDNQKYSGLFPSVSFAWKAISTKNTNLKLRLSWGQTGNSDVISDGTSSDWEVKTTYNVGVDASFMNNKVELNEDFFVKKTVNDTERTLIYGNELNVGAKNSDWSKTSNINSAVAFEKTEDGSELYSSGFGANFTFNENPFDCVAYFSYNYLRDFDINSNIESKKYEKQIKAYISTGYNGNGKNNESFRFADTINVDMVLIDGAYAPDLKFITSLSGNGGGKLKYNVELNSSFLLINNSERDTSPVTINFNNSDSGSISAKQP